VDEELWLNGSEPLPMLEFVRGQASQRKLRLFACACCRRIGDLLQKSDSRNAVDIAERYADGQATEEERAAAILAATRLVIEWSRSRSDFEAGYACASTVAAFAVARADTMQQELAIPDGLVIDLTVLADQLYPNWAQVPV